MTAIYAENERPLGEQHFQADKMTILIREVKVGHGHPKRGTGLLQPTEPRDEFIISLIDFGSEFS